MTTVMEQWCDEHHWRAEWLVLPSWGKLHKLRDATELREDYVPIGVIGTTECGRAGWLVMPGIFSRMGLPRCTQCCRKLHLPVGDGAPQNDKQLQARWDKRWGRAPEPTE